MHVIGEIPTHLFLMSLIDLALVMLVAVVAGVGRVAVEMAGGARAPRALMVHGEGVRAIVRGRPPGAGRMAEGAIEPEYSCMKCRINVAGEAGCGRVYVGPTLVT
ncbi:MAG: hypothetical protein V3S81_05055, partial [Anaerolineales bacterium]